MWYILPDWKRRLDDLELYPDEDVITDWVNVMWDDVKEELDCEVKMRNTRQDMVSFYGKKNATALLKHAVAEEEAGRIGIYYVDKKKGLEVVKRAGLQLPGKLNNDGLIHMITEKESPVNRNNKKNQIETAQFKRWFGKSKAVDEKGTPRVLYHQTNGTFNEFDTKRNGAGTNDMLTPHGIFMKTTAEQVKTIQGEKQMALYASIQNPLEMRNREEAQAFFAENVNGYAELLKQMQTEEEAYRGELEKAEAEDDAWYSDHYQEIRSGEVTEVQDSTKGILHRWEQFNKGHSAQMGTGKQPFKQKDESTARCMV